MTNFEFLKPCYNYDAVPPYVRHTFVLQFYIPLKKNWLHVVKRYSGNLASRFIGCTYIKFKFRTTFYPAILDLISVQKKTLPEYLYFRTIFWSTILGVCASHLLCPTFENGGGTKSDDFGVCVGVPSQFFWSVPANGIKRVPIRLWTKDIKYSHDTS